MTDEQTLFVVLAVLYLAECLLWLRPGTPCFLGLRNNAWRFRWTSHFELGDRGGFVAAGMLPPLQTVIKGDPSGTSVNTQAIRTRIAECYRATRPLWFVCNLLFLYVFVVVPVVIGSRGLIGSWTLLLVGLVTSMLTAAWLFRSAYKTLYPERDWIGPAVSVSLWPPTAIRATDIVVRDALVGFAPAAVAYVLCPDDVFHAVARRAYFDAEEGEPIDELLRCTGTYNDVMTPPSAEDHSQRAYCPRCHAQYGRAEGNCSDCPAVSLRPLSSVSPHPHRRGRWRSFMTGRHTRFIAAEEL